VIEQGTADPGGLGFIYERIASILAQDFANIGPALGMLPAAEASAPAAALKVSAVSDYENDVFVSHDGSGSDWMLEFVEELRLELRMLLAGDPRVFFDQREVHAGEDWPQAVRHALLRSRVMVALLTQRYLSTPSSMAEFRAFVERNSQTGRKLVAPVLIRSLEKTSVPPEVATLQWLDMSRTAGRRSRGRSPEWQNDMQHLATVLADMITSAPPFDAKWEAKTDWAPLSVA